MRPKSYMPSGFSPNFFRAVGICSVLSALTTLGLIFLPRAYPAPDGLEAEVALRLNGFYQARSLVYYVHPFLVLTAAWGVVARKFRESAGAVTTGFLFSASRALPGPRNGLFRRWPSTSTGGNDMPGLRMEP